jgi:hypothetical protein
MVKFFVFSNLHFLLFILLILAAFLLRLVFPALLVLKLLKSIFAFLTLNILTLNLPLFMLNHQFIFLRFFDQSFSKKYLIKIELGLMKVFLHRLFIQARLIIHSYNYQLTLVIQSKKYYLHYFNYS